MNIVQENNRCLHLLQSYQKSESFHHLFVFTRYCAKLIFHFPHHLLTCELGCRYVVSITHECEQIPPRASGAADCSVLFVTALLSRTKTTPLG